MISVYVLLSAKDGQHYVGMTNDLSRRMHEHQCGKVLSTRRRIPFTLIYSEVHPDRTSARVREKYFKSAAGRQWLKKISGEQQPSNLPD